MALTFANFLKAAIQATRSHVARSDLFSSIRHDGMLPSFAEVAQHNLVEFAQHILF